MRAYILSSILLLFITFSCKQDSQTPLLIGQWQGVSWKVNGEASSRDFNSVTFEFRPDNTYSANYGKQREQGNFRLKGDKLYTTAENKIEKMVKLSTLTADTIVMDMNRVGVAEELVLVKR